MALAKLGHFYNNISAPQKFASDAIIRYEKSDFEGKEYCFCDIILV
jgi:hypothetical protein